MIFKYIAYDSHGTKIESHIDAENEGSAKVLLKKRGLTIVSVFKQDDNQSLSKGFINKKISLQSLEYITSELAILLKSGVRFDRGLDILTKGAAEQSVANLLSKLSQNIKSGKTISDSFNNIYFKV